MLDNPTSWLDVDYPSEVPHELRTDFARIQALQPRQIYLMRRNLPRPLPRLPVASHSGFLVVTDRNRVLAASGDPVHKPENLSQVVIQELVKRKFRHDQSSPGRIDYGLMVPTIYELPEKRRGAGHREFLDTRLFDHIVQGQGVGGLRPKKFVQIFPLPVEDLNTTAQSVFAHILAYTAGIIRGRYPYNPKPLTGTDEINCHGYTMGIAAEAGILSLVDSHLRLAIGRSKRPKSKPSPLIHS